MPGLMPVTWNHLTAAELKVLAQACLRRSRALEVAAFAAVWYPDAVKLKVQTDCDEYYYACGVAAWDAAGTLLHLDPDEMEGSAGDDYEDDRSNLPVPYDGSEVTYDLLTLPSVVAPSMPTDDPAQFV